MTDAERFHHSRTPFERAGSGGDPEFPHAVIWALHWTPRPCAWRAARGSPRRGLRWSCGAPLSAAMGWKRTRSAHTGAGGRCLAPAAVRAGAHRLERCARSPLPSLPNRFVAGRGGRWEPRLAQSPALAPGGKLFTRFIGETLGREPLPVEDRPPVDPRRRTTARNSPGPAAAPPLN